MIEKEVREDLKDKAKKLAILNNSNLEKLLFFICGLELGGIKNKQIEVVMEELKTGGREVGYDG